MPQLCVRALLLTTVGLAALGALPSARAASDRRPLVQATVYSESYTFASDGRDYWQTEGLRDREYTYDDGQQKPRRERSVEEFRPTSQNFARASLDKLVDEIELSIERQYPAPNNAAEPFAGTLLEAPMPWRRETQRYRLRVTKGDLDRLAQSDAEVEMRFTAESSRDFLERQTQRLGEGAGEFLRDLSPLPRARSVHAYFLARPGRKTRAPDQARVIATRSQLRLVLPAVRVDAELP